MHIPFCRHRCIYCDFITYAGQEKKIAPYVASLQNEISYRARQFSIPSPIKSIYFGGGTPSLLSIELLQGLLEVLRNAFRIAEDAEISFEANPGTINADYLRALRVLGVNRLSLGVQSFDDDELRMLGRIHNASDALECCQLSRLAGFEQLNLDLIFGLPGQTLASWVKTLHKATEIGVNHLSLYNLIVEEGTPLFTMLQEGHLILPDEDAQADMYEMAIDRLPALGYTQYEISNWARGVQSQSQHNRAYWLREPYLGLGIASHSQLGNWRWHNPENLDEYIGIWAGLATSPLHEMVDDFTCREKIQLTRLEEMQEAMFLGLRLTEDGVSVPQFEQRYGKRPEEVFSKEISKLIRQGLVEWADLLDGPHLRLSRRGLLLGNRVFAEFV